MTKIRSLLIITALLCLIVATTLLVYANGLKGSFLLDDLNNIFRNEALSISSLSPSQIIRAALSGKSGPLGRPISYLTFSLNLYFSASDPFGFKLTNLIIHLVNGVLLFFLSKQLLSLVPGNLSRSRVIVVAAAASAIWLLHPLQVSTTLYVVQRMASLAALFTICGSLLYCAGRLQMASGKFRAGIITILFSFMICTILASLSKESGLLLPVFLLSIEYTFFSPLHKNPRHRKFARLFFTAIVFIPLTAGLLYLILNPDNILGGYTSRPFSLNQRLMTEARIICQYIKLILLPQISEMSIYHDDITLSKSLISPITTLPAIAVITCLPVLAGLIRKRYPVLSFAIFWFFTGHLIESTIVPLELMFEHRNYLSLFGPAFAVTYYLACLSLQKKYTVTSSACLLIIIIFLAANTYFRAFQWSNPLTMAETEARNHPSSTRAQYVLGRIYSGLFLKTGTPEFADKATDAFSAATDNSNSPAGLFGLLILRASQKQSLTTAQENELIQRLKRSPPKGDSFLQLTKLVNCKQSGNCPDLKTDKINRLLNAFRENKRLSHSRKDDIRILQERLRKQPPEKTNQTQNVTKFRNT